MGNLNGCSDFWVGVRMRLEVSESKRVEGVVLGVEHFLGDSGLGEALRVAVDTEFIGGAALRVPAYTLMVDHNLGCDRVCGVNLSEAFA